MRMAVVIVALVALVSATLGIVHPALGSESAMPGCSSVDRVGVCPMDPLEHLVAWQNTFAATIPDGVLLVALVCLLFCTASHDPSLEAPRKCRVAPPSRSVLAPPDPDFLERAFSRGILHSRAW